MLSGASTSRKRHLGSTGRAIPVALGSSCSKSALVRTRWTCRAAGWSHPEIDDQIDVCCRSGVIGAALDFMQEDRLAADEQTLLTEIRRQLDECAPRLALSTNEER